MVAEFGIDFGDGCQDCFSGCDADRLGAFGFTFLRRILSILHTHPKKAAHDRGCNRDLRTFRENKHCFLIVHPEISCGNLQAVVNVFVK